MVKELTPKQKEVILEFVKTGNVEQACENIGVARSTYYEWMKIPEFKEEIKQQQEQVYESTVSNMKYLFSKAVETQEQLLNSENERIKLRVSSSIINNTVKLLEVASFKERLEQIEKQVEQSKQFNELMEKIDEMRA